MKKSLVANLAVGIISLLVSLIGAELLLRYILFGKQDVFIGLREPSHYALYCKDVNEDFFSEDYYKLNYLFGRGFDLDVPNPLLGWNGYFNRMTLVHQQADQVKTRLPVLLYGDSFAMCIDSTDCFEEILNSDSAFSSEHFLLNYGVGGYGLDQIYLLFRETAGKFRRPFVVFSMLTTDLDRSMLTVRDAPKPYFTLDSGELRLRGIPLKSSSRKFFDENPPNITSYLLNRVRTQFFQNSVCNDAERQLHIRRIKELNEKILAETFIKLKSLGSAFVILLFQPSWYAEDDWRLNFLKEVCIRHEVPFICNSDRG